MKHREFFAHHDNGDLYPQVEVRVYDTIHAMRQAAYMFNHAPACGAYGFTQRCEDGGAIIRLALEAIGLRPIVHECSHAAIILNGNQVSDWLDEGYCHIHDELTCDILSWIVEDLLHGIMPIDPTLPEKETK